MIGDMFNAIRCTSCFIAQLCSSWSVLPVGVLTITRDGSVVYFLARCNTCLRDYALGFFGAWYSAVWFPLGYALVVLRPGVTALECQ